MKAVTGFPKDQKRVLGEGVGWRRETLPGESGNEVGGGFERAAKVSKREG